SLVGYLFVFETDHQLIINVEAALVEVGRADIDDVINDDQFCVKDLRLVLINGNAGPEEAAIETLAGQLRDEHVGFAGKNHLNAPATSSDLNQTTADPPGWQKIGDDDLDIARLGQIA